MLRISAHIERLLLVNDCVIIPEFGGFVLQSHPAVYAAREHVFHPPRKEIVFNPALRHNDGLLSESYMQTYSMEFRDAHFLLKKDVEDLKTELEEKGYVVMGTAGSFRKERKGRYLFQPGAASSAFLSNINAYGLDTFHLPPLQTTSILRAGTVSLTRTRSKNGRGSYLPLRRAAIYATVAAAAVIALFLFTSMPVEEVNRMAYTAGFTLSEILPEPATPVEQLPAPVLQPEEASVTPPAPAAPETAPPSQTPPVQQEQLASVQSQKAYYIVIGSFRTEAQAEKFLTGIPVSECKETGVVTHGEHVRVYAARYGNREDAETYLLQLRSNEKFKNAWLFAGR